MKNKNVYAPTSLDSFINESKTITLKRSYGGQPSVTVGSKAPVRNQIISYVAEGRRVAKSDLRKFISGLNEGKSKPAAANMWLKRNSKFFITENKNGITYYKLSKIGQRLAGMLTPNQEAITETNKPGRNLRRVLGAKTNESDNPFTKKAGKDLSEDGAEYDFIDKKRGYGRPGIYSMEEMEEECEGCEEDEVIEETIDPTKGKRRMFKKSEWENLLEGKDKEKEDEDEDDEKISESTKAKFKKILNDKLNEQEDDEIDIETDDDIAPEEDIEDEFSFDDLDLGGEDTGEEDTGEEDTGEEDTGEEDTDEEDGAEKGEDYDEEDVDKVEITAFEVTVDDTDAAISELEELGITAEKVDNEGEEQIKVQAEDWEVLKGWLEEKGVDIEEMFGGEIEVEETDEVVSDLGDEGEGDGELDSEEFDLDFGAGDEDGAEEDAGEEDGAEKGEEEEVKESITGMEKEEKAMIPNLVK